MTAPLEKTYNPSDVESRWYDYWIEKKYFHANPETDKPPYVVVIPPPNVTGILTMGHVLNNTLQDILVRHARMQGFETLWLPGTDHAGIATQNVVEKNLKKSGKTRFDYDREEFVKIVWDWALKHKSIIINQLKKIGCSLDWERERFTFDEGLSHAVRKVFVHLYQKGLIYRGRRIINWCPASRTALSDEEVIHKETQGHLWYFKYPLEDKSGFIVVATTRPETMLGDTAVAVNPKDKRYVNLVGKNVVLPIQNRVIPIIADDFVDPAFGTGAVKVTPAHDPNDFEIGARHGLAQINVMNPDATMNDAAGELVAGKDRFEARNLVVAEMERLGLFQKVENYLHSVGYSERAGVMIEPYLSEQWFVKMAPLAEPALKVVEERKIQFHPERWYKTYSHWMSNVRDWCISRQLWWGHRIPVFYCDACGWMDALTDDPEKCPKCGGKVRQDTDVLDTWFSSWLWPFSTMGWPDETRDLKAFFPTNDLVTAPDIIFFWVARMIMASLEFRGDIPFKDVYFTGIIRDIQGRKMSKSLGNSPDPIDLVNRFGADALRFGVMLIAPQGQDILFSEERLEVGRNFMNKIWNASRFILMNLDDETILNEPFEPNRLNLLNEDKQILNQLYHAIRNVDKNLKKYRFDEVARNIYDFVWSDFCDRYIEEIKKRLYKKSPEEKRTALTVAVYVLKNFLKLLHPYAPFITEEIYQKIKSDDEPDIIVSSWPKAEKRFRQKEIEDDYKEMDNIVDPIRTIRSEKKVPPSFRLKKLWVLDNKSRTVEVYKNPEYQENIKIFTRTDEIYFEENVENIPSQLVSLSTGSTMTFPDFGSFFNSNDEKARLEKEIARLEGQLKASYSKLSNPSFIAKAPKEVVLKEREKESFNKEQLVKLKASLAALSD